MGSLFVFNLCRDNDIQRTMKGRKMQSTLGKPLLNYMLLLYIYCSCSYCLSSFIDRTCDDIGTFQQMFGISLPMCAEECFRRQRCAVFMFRFGMNYCALKDAFSLQSLGEEGPVCQYFTRDDWSQIDLGPCNGHNCSETERCISKTDDTFECVKSECPPPCEIADARLMSNSHSIGATNRYKCNTGFVGHGTPTITCDGEAEWSVTDFLCISRQSCPVPKDQYINADLTQVEGSLYTPGTILTFTCREGYKKTGDDLNTECQTGLQWKPKNIACCPEQSTHLWNNSCLAIVDAGVVTSRDDAAGHCKSIGAKLTWTNKEMEDLFNKTKTDWVLQAVTVSQIETEWNYTECAINNGAQGEVNQTLKENINEAKSKWWDGKSCWFGTMWSPGQPDLTGDDCVARNISMTKIKNHDDIPCNFKSIFRVGFVCRFVHIFV